MPRSLFSKLAGRKRLALVATFVVALALVPLVALPVLAAPTTASNGNGAATLTLTKPTTGMSTGDLMLAHIVYRGTTTVTPPLGWTEITAAKRTNTTGTPVTQVVYRRIVDGTEPVSWNWGFVPDAAASGAIAHYSGVDTADPIAAVETNPASDSAQLASTSIEAPSVTTTGPNMRLVSLFGLANNSGGVTSPSGMTQVYDASNGGSSPRRAVATTQVQAAEGASGTKIATAASTTYVAATIALRPKPTQLGFSTPARAGAPDECLGPITVQTQNASGAVDALNSTDVGLATDGAGAFFSGSDCSAPTSITQGTIPTGETSFTLYYKPTAVGSHTITATATGLTQAQQVQTVKLTQTINWPDVLPASEIYGEGIDVGTATSIDNTSSTPTGLPVTITPSGGCSPLTGSTTTVTSAATDCTITASQPGDSTYAAATPIVRTVSTDPRPITVTADPKSAVYDAGTVADPVLTYQVTSGTLAPGDTLAGSLTGSLTRESGENVGTYDIQQGTLAANSNYTLTFADGTDLFTITKRPLDLNANNASKTYGSADPTFTAEPSGFVGSGQNKNTVGITGAPDCTRTPAPGVEEDAGTYVDAISCAEGTLSAPNYSFQTGTAGDFTINKKQLSINANPASKTYGSPDPGFTGTLAGFAFSDTASVVSGAASCSRTGGEDADTYTGAITCAPGTLTASNYTFATGTSAAFTINPKPLDAIFTAADKVYDQTTAAQVTSAELDAADIVAGDEDAGDLVLDGTPSGAFGSASAGEDKAVSVSGVSLSGLRAANYSLVVNDATADITPKPVDVSFTAANKVYDGTAAASVTGGSVDAADVIAPDEVTFAGGSANFSSKTVGTGKTVTLAAGDLGGAAGANYTVEPGATDTADITKRNVTGSITAADKDYDGTQDARITGRSLTGAVVGDSVSLTGGSAFFEDANPGIDKDVLPFAAAFSLTGADAGNYNLAGINPTTATIRQRGPGSSNPPPDEDLTNDAEDLLGGDVKVLNLNLGGIAFAFARENQGNTLKVGKRGIKLFAIGGCDVPCTIKAGKTIVLTTEGGASAAAKRKIKLKAQNLSLAAGELGVVKLKKLSRKQRKAIRKADRAKLVVKVTVTAGAEQVAGKKKYRLKAPK